MLDTIVRAVEDLPAQPATRRAALDALQQHGLPNKKQEDWRHSDLSVLKELSVSDVAPSLENHEYPPAYDCGLDALNAALAGGRQSRNLQGTVVLDTGLHQRLRLRITGDTELTLNDLSATRFATFFAVIEVAANTRLRLLRVQNTDAQAQRLTQLNILLARDAQLEIVSADLGGRFVRNDLHVHLNEPGAGVHLRSLYAPVGNEHVDNHTWIHHHAPQCQSRVSYRGIINDRARAVVNGKVIVHEGARKTDSETHIANLLLSDTADVYAKPELEIYNDDVKCAHGATFGQLDDAAIFYLRARGLNAETARSLLTYTFAHEVLSAIANDTLRAMVQRRFLARLPQGHLLGDVL